MVSAGCRCGIFEDRLFRSPDKEGGVRVYLCLVIGDRRRVEVRVEAPSHLEMTLGITIHVSRGTF
jgi:hypothetical protein